MSGPDKHRHDASVYERPRNAFQCGRASMWSKPCWQGASGNGTCGGESDCTPVRKGDRWECRRPKRAGGACTEGPRPDGSCATVRPPCVPRPTLRRWRGRFSLLALGLVLTLIAAGASFAPQSSVVLSSIHPGALSSVHAGFTDEQGCGACHMAHDETGLAWFTAAFLPQDNTGRCLQCHGFAQPERTAHNATFGHRDDLHEIECDACHTEHQGVDFAPATVSSKLCQACHLPTFKSFDDGHPKFQAAFPYQIPNSINFNHSSHLDEYFTDERWTQQANRDAEFAARAVKSCIACHQVETATREVKPRPYEAVCANCHDAQIRDRELIVFSPDEVYPVAALLFGLDEDADEIDENLLEVADGLAQESLDSLAAHLDNLGQAEQTQRLFEGLGTEVVFSAGRAWRDGNEYEPEVLPDLEVSGWRSGEDSEGGQSIHYRPTGHSDPLLRTWVEFLLTLKADEDADTEFVDVALEHLLDSSEGPGACGKCHALGVSTSMLGEGGVAQWSFRGSANRPHTAYSHGPHIELLGPDASCGTCHELDSTADYDAYFSDIDSPADEYRSNFSGIKKQTCDKCHQPDLVQSDCLLCHRYHQEPSFKVNFQQRDASGT